MDGIYRLLYEYGEILTRVSIAVTRAVISAELTTLLCFVCLFGFNVALKHLRSYHDGACL